MICRKCGREIDKNTKFCKYCGAPTNMEEKEQMNVSEDKICPACGTVNKAENTYCINCGTDLDHFPSLRTVQVPSNKERGKKKWLLLCIAIVIVIAGIIIFLLMRGQDHDNSNVKNNMAREEPTVENEEKEDNENNDIEINIDKELEPIEETLEEIKGKISGGQYDERIIDANLNTYYEGDELRAIITSGDDAYAEREYYFDRNQLIYAEFRGEEEQRLFFENEELICWDSVVSGVTKRVTRYDDLNENSEFFIWEADTLESADALLTVISSSTVSENSDFILPESDRRFLSKDELENLTQEELKLARNEIYARHGYVFSDEYLKSYFGQFEWYQPTIAPENFQESMLNEFEIYNRDLIVEYETERGYR